MYLTELLICHVISTLVYNLSLSTNEHSTVRAKIFNFAALPPSTRTWHIVGGQSVFRHQTSTIGIYFLRSLCLICTAQISLVRPSLQQQVLVCMCFLSLYLCEEPQLFTASTKRSLQAKLPNLLTLPFPFLLGTCSGGVLTTHGTLSLPTLVFPHLCERGSG